MKNKFKVILFTVVMACSIFVSIPVMASQQSIVVLAEGDTTDIQPRTDIKEWRYKVINGNLYKRLYNYSTGRWEGDWIFVASGVEEA